MCFGIALLGNVWDFLVSLHSNIYIDLILHYLILYVKATLIHVWRTVKAGVKAMVECLAKPHLTACICKASQAVGDISQNKGRLRMK